MKILSIGTRETATTITLFARCKIRRVGYDEAYFTFEKKYKPFLKVDASPFASSLLIPSMKRGEDLVIDGAISESLYNGMHEIMELFLSWDMGLHPIKIIAKELTKDTAKPKVTASFFSGGVDSFYTFLKHKNDAKDPLDHIILVNGFDIDPRNTDLWDATLSNVQKVATAEHAALIKVESNIRSLIDPILPWGYTHGGCLAAVGLCLRNGLKQVYVPSSCAYNQQIPWGTHMEADTHWGTEKLSFIHDGTEATRIEKIGWQIAKSPVALQHLRVCYMNEKDTFNCGVCEKCLRTMMNLAIAGALDSAKTFPAAIDVDRVAKIPIDEHCAHLHRENLVALHAQNLLPEVQNALLTSLENLSYDTETPLLERTAAQLRCLDHMYTRGNFFRIAQTAFGRKF